MSSLDGPLVLVLRDILHVVFLGTAKDLLPSLLADWLDHGLLGGPNMSIDDRLRAFSLEMHAAFRQERSLMQSFAIFLGSNSKKYNSCTLKTLGGNAVYVGFQKM